VSAVRFCPSAVVNKGFTAIQAVNPLLFYNDKDRTYRTAFIFFQRIDFQFLALSQRFGQHLRIYTAFHNYVPK